MKYHQCTRCGIEWECDASKVPERCFEPYRFGQCNDCLSWTTRGYKYGGTIYLKPWYKRLRIIGRLFGKPYRIEKP